MLEKIGLPAKPSLRGNNWVEDASHCQGCSSQFTFINRKHHCRRCGGLFCNSCTLQRMFLRGQGDSPVRICEPCKKLEEAARFELRHGNRNRAVKAGSSRNVSKNKDELLAEILGNDAKISSSSGSGFITKARSSTVNSAGNSFSYQGDANLDGMVCENHVADESEAGSASPEELRQRALDEKKKYKILKGEGKPEEALKAFKRGKELERQADALELNIRKRRKKFSSVGNIVENQEGTKESVRKNRPHGGKVKEKDDVMSELRELGWSEMDINSEDRKPTSLEGELSALIGEIPQKPNAGKGNLHIDKTQVLAHKKQALALKREGKLAEAKEELKKAKVLEKQLEEQELLAGAENSDDELSELIRNMDDDNQENYSHKREQNFDMDDLLGIASSIGADGNFDVADADMEDPEISAALKSLGWDEEPNTFEDGIHQPPPVNGEVSVSELPSKCDALDVRPAENNSVLINRERKKSKAEIQRELLGLKRKALSLRREGKMEEAEEVLKTAKTLESLIAEMEVQKDATLFSSSTPPSSKVAEENDEDITENDMQDPALLSMLKDLGWNEELEPVTVPKGPPKQIADGLLPPGLAMIQSSSRVSAGPPRSKAKIQRELLGLKRKALELRRKGEMEEAEEILRRAKVLEAEIEELDAPKEPQIDAAGVPDHVGPHNVGDALTVNEVLNKEVENVDTGIMSSKIFGTNVTDPPFQKSDQPAISLSIEEAKSSSSGAVKSEPIHLSAGQGISTSKSAHLVNLMDMETDDDQRNSIVSAGNSQVSHNVPYLSFHPPDATSDMIIKEDVSVRKCDDHDGKIPQVNQTTSIQENVHPKSQNSVRQAILEHKKKAVDLKRQGKLAEAKEELKHAKLLERSLQEEESNTSTEVVPSEREHDTLKSSHKPLSSQERFKIQQESLGHKRQALKLRKEGKMKEAEAEFDLAKALEAQLEDSHGSSKSSEDSTDNVVVEDFLDPELLSALKAIGIGDPNSVSRTLEKPEPVKPNVGSSDISSQDKMRLEEQIKAEKIKAVNLKRSGKQAEALDALRQAKLLEKKLNSMTA